MKKLIALCLFLFISCKNETITYPPNNLEVFYFKPGILYPMSLGCKWINNAKTEKGKTKYERIYDKASIDEFLKLYNKYEVDTIHKNLDARIHILVHKGVKADTLCLGENFGTAINGQQMKDSKELLNFIKKKINYNQF